MEREKIDDGPASSTIPKGCGRWSVGGTGTVWEHRVGMRGASWCVRSGDEMLWIAGDVVVWHRGGCVEAVCMVAVAEEAGLKGVEQYEVWKEPVKMMYDETIDEEASSVADVWSDRQQCTTDGDRCDYEQFSFAIMCGTLHAFCSTHVYCEWWTWRSCFLLSMYFKDLNTFLFAYNQVFVCVLFCYCQLRIPKYL